MKRIWICWIVMLLGLSGCASKDVSDETEVSTLQETEYEVIVKHQNRKYSETLNDEDAQMFVEYLTNAMESQEVVLNVRADKTDHLVLIDSDQSEFDYQIVFFDLEDSYYFLLNTGEAYECTQEMYMKLWDYAVIKEEEVSDAMWAFAANGNLYVLSEHELSFSEVSRVVNGTIVSQSENGAIPDRDNQSNFGTGNKYSLKRDGYAEVFINGEWILFYCEQFDASKQGIVSETAMIHQIIEHQNYAVVSFKAINAEVPDLKVSFSQLEGLQMGDVVNVRYVVYDGNVIDVEVFEKMKKDERNAHSVADLIPFVPVEIRIEETTYTEIGESFSLSLSSEEIVSFMDLLEEVIVYSDVLEQTGAGGTRQYVTFVGENGEEVMLESYAMVELSGSASGIYGYDWDSEFVSIADVIKKIRGK